MRASTVDGLVSCSLVLLSLVWLHSKIRHLGHISLGGVTLWLTLVFFLGKWFLLGEDMPPLVTGPRATREATLAVVAYGSLAFAVGYRRGGHRLRAFVQSASIRRHADVSARPLIVVGLAVVLLRLYAAGRWHIGVPSRAPRPIPLRGMLFFATTVVPPLVSASLKLKGDERGGSSLLIRAGAGILLLHTAVGVLIGWRGEPLRNALVWIAASRGSGAIARSRHEIGRLLAIGVGIFLAVGIALTFRGLGANESGGPAEVAQFLFERIGGIDYLTPVVGQVEIYGTDARLLDQKQWDNFLKRRVHGISEGAQVSFAGTAFGWWYASLGSLGVIAGSLAAGSLCSIVDRGLSQSDRHRHLGYNLLFVGIVLVWSNFFLEGNGVTSLKSLVAVVFVWGGICAYFRLGGQQSLQSFAQRS